MTCMYHKSAKVSITLLRKGLTLPFNSNAENTIIPNPWFSNHFFILKRFEVSYMSTANLLIEIVYYKKPSKQNQ